MNNKGADQTAQMRRMICDFIVSIRHKTRFLMARLMYFENVFLCHFFSKATVKVGVVLVFYGPSTLFRSFRARSVNLSTLFLGKPPRLFNSS